MAIAIDATTPAIVTGTTTCTTASFTAPANSLLVALGAAADGAATLSMSNSGTGLTWTTQVQHMTGEDSGAFAVAAFIATAVAVPSVARTVTFTTSSGGSTVDMKLLVVTGADIAGTPVGAKGEGHSSTANLSAAVYTSTVAQSRAVGIGTDSTATGGSPTSSDTGFAFDHAFDASGIAVYKSADTGSSGTGVTLNFNGSGTRTWNWAAIEILPAVASFAAPRPLTPGMSAPIFRGAYY
ncbi:hypothetical protein AB0F17_16005 [Nonomuraea sp. NPDC026600]|uniref:hypothetical protein n=1 Tax=Nonomuraea sp. NPDC026600 TaxID=3155363 RepID=UPI0033DBA26E